MNFQTKVYVGNLPEKCSLEDLRNLFEEHGKVVECDIVKNYGFVHFADGEDAKLAVDKLHDTEWNGVTLKVEISYSKVRHKPGMGNKSVCYRCGKAGHWSKECPKGPSRASSWHTKNDSSNNLENYRGQSLRIGNRGPSINIGTSGSSGGLWDLQKNDRFADLNNNGYRSNNPLRDSTSYRLLSSPYYERNSNDNNIARIDYSTTNSNSGYYHNTNGYSGEHRNRNSGDTDVMGFSSRGDREDYTGRNDDPCDSYPPPTRYRPYPNAYERRTPGSPLSRSTDTFRPSSFSSSSSSSSHHHHHPHHQHQYSNGRHHSSSPSPTSHSHDGGGGNFHDLNSYVRPTQQLDHHEQRRGHLKI